MHTSEMPHRDKPRQVHFQEPLLTLRPAREDELSVMRSFAGHLLRCRRCAFTSDGEEGLLLCRHGYGYAKDVFNYMYLHNGRIFSTVILKRGEPIQIEIPKDCRVIYRLLAQRHRNPQRQPVGGRTGPSERTRLCPRGRENSQRPQSDMKCLEGESTGYVTIHIQIPSMTIPVCIRRSHIIFQ